jgi:hypothetical protein
MKIEFTIPLTKDLIVSEANRGMENRFVKKKRHKIQSDLINTFLNIHLPKDVLEILPCEITMIRIAPRQFDEEDNLRMAFKWIKDYIAARLIPGSKSGGHKDGDKRITWLYGQERGKVREYAIRVEITNDKQI